jgi:hypothetical protein
LGTRGEKCDFVKQGQDLRPDWSNNAENMFFSFLVLYFVIFLLLVKSLLLVERGTEVEGPVMEASACDLAVGAWLMRLETFISYRCVDVAHFVLRCFVITILFVSPI